MKYVLYILAAFIFSFGWFLFPGAQYFVLLAAGIGLLLWLIYAVVKAAVKAALREHDEEKAKQNGPQ